MTTCICCSLLGNAETATYCELEQQVADSVDVLQAEWLHLSSLETPAIIIINIITMLSALAICHHHPYSVAHMYMHLLMSSHVEHLNQASRQLLNLH